MPRMFQLFACSALLFLQALCNSSAQPATAEFKVVSFYTGKDEPAHLSFVHEANRWFAHTSQEYNFRYDSTSNWENLNADYLKNYQLVIFLDTRPPLPEQRKAFEDYMKQGGAWLGFHFAAFDLENSAFPNDWDWYHEQFLGAGEYKGNTWRPTTAILRNEDTKHPVMADIPETFTASPNEWYSWENDLRENPYIKILASIDPLSFPLGTGPKLYEIWHQGYYPVVWTNTRYRMIYFNMGHNDLDYEHGTNNELSFTFGNAVQDQLVINAIQWLLKNN